MPRFFLENENIADGQICITADDAYHIARSLRMAVGDRIYVCDNTGTEYLCELEKIRDDECVCKIISRSVGKSESPVEITLFMAYPKADKLETVTQKAVELGASEIVPFESSRCIKRPKAEKADKNLMRLNRIAREAAMQSGRCKIAKVMPPCTFKEALSSVKNFDCALFCYEGDGTVSLKDHLEALKEKMSECESMRQSDTKTPKTHENIGSESNTVLPKTEPTEAESSTKEPSQAADTLSETTPGGLGTKRIKLAVFVGSEGGFSAEEAQAALDAGCKMTNLGPRILRCETAPDYVLSAISYAFEL